MKISDDRYSKVKWVLTLLLLLSAGTATAGHVRTYFFLANDSTTVFEDEHVKLFFVFSDLTKQLELRLSNKDGQTIYLHDEACVVNTNDHQEPLGKVGVSRFPIAPGETCLLHGWTELLQHIDQHVVEQGRYGRMLEWKTGHKGKFVNPEDGTKEKFQKGTTKQYDFMHSPLAVSARLAYSIGTKDGTLHHASVRHCVTEVYVGKCQKGLSLGSDVPAAFANRCWFSSDSGGCNPITYTGGKTILLAGYATVGIFILTFELIKAKLEQDY